MVEFIVNGLIICGFLVCFYILNVVERQIQLLSNVLDKLEDYIITTKRDVDDGR